MEWLEALQGELKALRVVHAQEGANLACLEERVSQTMRRVSELWTKIRNIEAVLSNYGVEVDKENEG